jgi:uncharacterized membrane protein
LNWEIILRLVILLLASLATGGLMVNWVGLARAMARISSASAYTEFHQATNNTFDPYMPIVVSGATLGGIALAAISPGIHSAAGALAVAGAICYVAVIAITLPTNLRINNLIARWSIEAPPENWTTVRARWIRFHILRTLISVPALASYVLSVLLSKG